MKINKKIIIDIIILIIALVFLVRASYKEYTNHRFGFKVTPDTIIIPNSKMSKYVTQEEIRTFSYENWDINDERDHTKESSWQKELRHLLKQKDTNKVLKYLKDNNISADAKMLFNLTPLMYSSFYDDANTTKELIKLGANVNQTDDYELSPLAYAIEHNSTKSAKVLLDSGADPNRVTYVQNYFRGLTYENGIRSLEIDKDGIKINYKQDYDERRAHSTFTDKKTGEKYNDYYYPQIGVFYYITYNNFVEIARMMFEKGYKPKYLKEFANVEDLEKTASKDVLRINPKKIYKVGDNTFEQSFYDNLLPIPNYEPMLDLLLEYNVLGQPSKEYMREYYLNNCLSPYRARIKDKFRLVEYNILANHEDEEKLIKLDFYYKDYNETIKLINDNGIKTKTPNYESLKKFDDYTEEIKWYAKFCSEDYMQDLKDFKGSGSLLYWASKEGYTSIYGNKVKGYKYNQNTFKDVKAFIAYRNERKKYGGITVFKNKNPKKVFLKDKNVTLYDFMKSKYENSTSEEEKEYIKNIIWTKIINNEI